MKLTVSRLIGLTLAFLAAGVPLRGDQPASSKGESKQGPMHDELARLVGSWDASVTYRMGERENYGKARCEAKWILDGQFVQQEYASTFMGMPLTIVQIIGYDAGAKKLNEIHLSSQGGGVLHNKGESEGGGKQWTFSGPFPDPKTHKVVQMRTLYTFQDPDHFTLDWYTPGPDGKEVRVVRIEHARRK